ncbi:hypothetical protein EPH_0007910 [Eimeria praecox]|uniref:NOA1/YqeH-like C-terminal domain-containing protein n=1 Tax=Eimeria praecox TaxID=51316 RepID=U6G303_9EIME|nr:hypothetical protein EPH_0007910 [Eimeria praecox]
MSNPRLVRTSKAADLLHRKAGIFLYPPHMPEDFNSLQPLVRHRVEVYGGRYTAHDDISIGGLGWFSVAGSGVKAFDIWLPKGVKLFRRPALARGPRISAQKRALAEQIKEEELRRQQQQQQENKEADTDAEKDTMSETAADTTKAPLVAPEDQEEFHMLISQCFEEGQAQEQQHHQHEQQQHQEKHHEQQQHNEQQNQQVLQLPEQQHEEQQQPSATC